MAIIYYPKSSVINRVDTQTSFGLYEQVSVSVTPNTVIYFDTSSNLNVISSSILYHTSSNSVFSISASYALNGGQSGGTTLQTGSFYPITSSWSQNALTASYINIMPSGSTLSSSYSLTASYALNGGSVGGGTTLTTGSFYPITSSWSQKSVTSSYFNEPSASLITGSLYLRSNSGSLWKVTVYEDADHNGTLQLEGPF